MAATVFPSPSSSAPTNGPVAIDSGAATLQQRWNVGVQWPQVIGVCHGQEWAPVAYTGLPRTTVTMQRFDASAPDNGEVVMPYLFQTFVFGGNTAPRYGLVGHTRGEAPSATGGGTDLCGVSGVASAQGNSDGRARGVYAEGNLDSTHPNAYALGAEVTVRNFSGAAAPVYNGVINRSTIGLCVEGGGNALNGVAILVKADPAAPFREGIIIEEGAVIGGGAAVRIQNNRWLASTKAGGGVQPLIGLGGDNTTRIFGDWIIFRSADDGKEICRLSQHGLQFPNGRGYGP